MTKYKVELGGDLVDALKKGEAKFIDNKLILEIDAEEWELDNKDDAYERALCFVTDKRVLWVESDSEDIEELE